jgi:hypothetical protein
VSVKLLDLRGQDSNRRIEKLHDESFDSYPSLNRIKVTISKVLRRGGSEDGFGDTWLT